MERKHSLFVLVLRLFWCQNFQMVMRNPTIPHFILDSSGTLLDLASQTYDVLNMFPTSLFYLIRFNKAVAFFAGCVCRFDGVTDTFLPNWITIKHRFNGTTVTMPLLTSSTNDTGFLVVVLICRYSYMFCWEAATTCGHPRVRSHLWWKGLQCQLYPARGYPWRQRREPLGEVAMAAVGQVCHLQGGVASRGEQNETENKRKQLPWIPPRVEYRALNIRGVEVETRSGSMQRNLTPSL